MAEWEMDHWVAAVTAKLGELSLTARTHVVEQETQLSAVTFDFHVHTRRTHVCPCTCTLKMFYFLF